ncbi:hypothetical protein [Microlunatus flavus]|uniref:Allene oxide cyclase barrel-like domain-containing protein n=1 Tax=Microlunatus flavus TaxID=1036181 RepID=A0A1H9KB60_9ACTN|nr:hypothetical protein [Microlunatus flavus]SEQ96446.1 hypothetical protein SAMN05421756_107140 [Microlunatus flavus]
MKMALRTTALVSAAAATATCLALAPVAAANPGGDADRPKAPRTVHVRGEQVPVDAANGVYTMEGDLVGEWLYVPRTPPLHTSDTLYVEAGTEVFRGCIDRDHDERCGRRDRRGEMHLAFLYWASFDLEGNLVRGQCVHPVTGGNGAFRGARGLLTMVDTPVGDEVRTTYRGEVVLDAVPSEAATPPADLPSGTTAAAKAAASARSRC